MNPPIFFIHVAKSAGTSLAAYMDRHFAASECLLQISEGAEALQARLTSADRAPLSGYSLVEAHARITETDRFGTPPFLVGLVRDPVERVISYYRHVCRLGGDDMYAISARAGFGVFLDVIGAAHEVNLFNAASYMFSDQDGRSSVGRMDVVGPTERMGEVCLLLAGLRGWRPPESAPGLRMMPDRIVPAPPATMAWLRSLCTSDIQLHESVHRLLDERLASLEQSLRKRHAGRDLFELVVAQYRHGFVRNLSALDLSFAEPLLGDGWHHRETDGSGTFWRWTGPASTSSVDLPILTDGSKRIEVWVVNAGSDEVFAALQFSVNGQRLQHQVRTDSGHYVCSFACPAEISARGYALTVEIKTPVTHLIPLIDPATPAHCGIAVSRIRVKPA